MQYWSPYHILPKDLLKGSLPNKGLIKKAKKRWIAEFELQDATTIKINNKVVDKDRLLKLFEQFENELQNKFHLSIYRSPQMLNFLESGDLSIFDDVDSITLLMLEPGFSDFIEVYFTERFNQIFYQAVKNCNYIRVKHMTSDTSYMKGSFEGSCFQKSYRFLKLRVLELKRFIEETSIKRIEDDQITNLFSSEFIKLSQMLPEYFYEVIDEYAIQAQDLAVHLHNDHRRSTLATFILRQGMKMNISGSTRNNLEYVLNQVVENSDNVLPVDINYNANRKLFWQLFLGINLLLFIFYLIKAIF